MSEENQSLLDDAISELPWYVRPVAKAVQRSVARRSTSDGIQWAIEMRCRMPLRKRRIRVAFAVSLKLAYNDRWFLARVPTSRHPETFAPFGGVVHHEHPIFLDGINFMPDPETTTFDDGPRADTDDLRGVLDGRSMPALFRWWCSDTREREATDAALNRELREELSAIGLPHYCDAIQDLTLRAIRDAVELYPVTGLPYDFQYRHFVIFEAPPTSRQNARFAESLAGEANSNPYLILASLDEIMRGTTRTGQRVAPHAAYLFGLRRNPGHG
jgi:hypothetical protein